jgi:AcrR family transcriptional regulator
MSRSDTVKSINKLSKSIIIKKAFDYADEHGIESLSMRNLAQALDVKAMSLYNHVKNKEDVIESITDELIGLMSYEVTPYWQSSMRHRAIALKDLLLKHRWGTLPLMYGFHTGPNITKDFNQSIGILRQGGFTYGECDQIISSINSYVYGYVLSRINFPIDEEAFQAVAESYEDFFPKDELPHLWGLSNEIRIGNYSGITDFDLGLSFIIKGIETTIDHKGENK